MRVRIGPVPDNPAFSPEQGDWHKLAEPSFGLLMVLSIPTGLLFGIGLLVAWTAVADIRDIEGPTQMVITPRTVLLSILILLALVMAHEAAHAVTLPRGGLTLKTTIGFWPERLTPYVSYEGEVSRNRTILVGLMPFVLLSLVPVLVGWLFGWMPLWLVLWSTVNAVLSSADVIGAILVAVQIPPSAIIRKKGLETWWCRQE